MESGVPGLRVIPEYLDAATHDELLAAADAQPWTSLGGRRVQIYGYSYDQRRGGAYRLGDLPAWAMGAAERVQRDGLSPDMPDQLIVNAYEPNQGIPRHRDAPLFTDTIVGLNLGSSCVMELTTDEPGLVRPVLLEPRSALVLSGPARHEWYHAIPARDVDRWLGRELRRARRVSMTFRKMLRP